MSVIRAILHPRLAANERAAKAQDEAYRQRESAHERGCQKGNPPPGRLLNAEIDRLAEQYSEVTYPEQQQAEYDAEVGERGPNWTYPEYEGPGYTEPAFDWEGWHQDHDPGWTFEEWAEERGYLPEEIAAAGGRSEQVQFESLPVAKAWERFKAGEEPQTYGERQHYAVFRLQNPDAWASGKPAPRPAEPGTQPSPEPQPAFECQPELEAN